MKVLKNLLLLARMDKPIGSILILFPCWWGVAYSQGLSFSLSLLMLFSLGAVVMRSAGCILNDFFDRDIDKKVGRTKNRPLAVGSITSVQALLCFVFLCVIGLLILYQLPHACYPWGIAGLALLIIYPLMKRITDFPQVVLGIAFNIGFPMAIVAATQTNKSILSLPVLLIYVAAILWTIAYDTIYAVQDREDDIKIGVGSTAILFGKNTKIITSFLYIISGILMGIAGIFNDYSFFYFCFTLIGYVYCLLKLMNLNLKDTAACREFFVSNQWIGVALFFAFVLA